MHLQQWMQLEERTKVHRGLHVVPHANEQLEHPLFVHMHRV
jgi:hypothetical protein